MGSTAWAITLVDYNFKKHGYETKYAKRRGDHGDILTYKFDNAYLQSVNDRVFTGMTYVDTFCPPGNSAICSRSQSGMEFFDITA